MRRHTSLITVAALLATWAWLLMPDLAHSPAVVWPSVLAVGLAFLTRDIYVSLFTGAFAGAVLLHGGNPWAAFLDLFLQRLIPALADRWNLSVLLFTLLMGGFVEVLNRNGGMASVSARVLGRTGGARRVALGAYGLGWGVFFDGLANAMLIGRTLRPLADRARLSREKLAFIVDSTSSPIAGLALLSTWVAYEMSVIREGFANATDGASGVEPFAWLVRSLPFRFYNLFMLLLVFLVIWLMRDWGPMHAAETKARSQAAREVERDGDSGIPASMALALVPLAALIVGVVGGLFADGGGLTRPFTFASLVEAFGAADAATVFVIATAGASALAMAMTVLWRRIALDEGGPGDSRRAFFDGMQRMFLPALILVFAWMLNSVTKELGTAAWLVSLLGDHLPSGLLPALIFLLAAMVSFSTGTSWGTMAIVMPLSIPLAVGLGDAAAVGPSSSILAGTIGAVLAGAVFGDHCSPISDTTVVSAFSCDCDVMAHVRTQMPYAVAAAVVAVVLGYGPAGFGISPWLLLPAGAAALWALVRYTGRPVPT